MSSSSSFGGEDFLQVSLPDYETAHFRSSVGLAVLSIFWLLIIPVWCSSSSSRSDTSESSDAGVSTTATTKEKPHAADAAKSSNGQHRGNNNVVSKNNKKKSKATTKTESSQEQKQQQSAPKSPTTPRRKVQKVTTRRVVNGKVVQTTTTRVTVSSSNNNSTKNTASRSSSSSSSEVSLYRNAVACAGFLASAVAWIMWSSPHNSYLPRRVFKAPLLTPSECQEIVARTAAVALKNYEQALTEEKEAEESQTHNISLSSSSSSTNSSKLDRRHLLQEPLGWRKLRHANYPTTDLNLVTDPFSKNDLDYFAELFDRRLTPTLARIYGISPASIRANDMFVVRYDAGKRTHLANHTDDADISINILLTDDFQGGGTKFWNRLTKAPFAHVEPTRVGTMLTHGAQLNHEGYTVSAGTRMILVGFLSVDRFDPFASKNNNKLTGLSWWASWFSLPWVHVKVREGMFNAKRRLYDVDSKAQRTNKWTEWQYGLLLLEDLTIILNLVLDFFAPHRVESLVREQDSGAYLQALDDAYYQQQQVDASNHEPQQQASWFKGQQINLDIDGTIDSEWETRAVNQHRFLEL